MERLGDRGPSGDAVREPSSFRSATRGSGHLASGDMRVDVVLPCLNEAAALPWVLARIPVGWRAVVVDNGSTDDSVRIAVDAGAHVIHEARRGFGAACHAGLLACDAEIVAFLDADGSLDPAQLHRVVDPVRSGDADLVLAARRPTGSRAWPWHLQLANRELARRINRRSGLRLRDLGPMRAGRRERLLELEVQDRRSGYPLETVVRAADAGWRIVEVQADYRPRLGRSKVTGTPLGAARAVRDMSRVLTR